MSREGTRGASPRGAGPKVRAVRMRPAGSRSSWSEPSWAGAELFSISLGRQAPRVMDGIFGGERTAPPDGGGKGYRQRS